MSFSRRLSFSFLRLAEGAPALVEAVVFAAFFTTLLLSCFGLLGSPVAYGICLILLSKAWLVLAGRSPLVSRPFDSQFAQPFLFYVIAFFLLFLIVQSFFTPPASSDGLRIKLPRILLGVEYGAAWATTQVDALSLMYYTPAPFYFIFTPIEALHLPQAFYSIANTALLLGALLSMLQLFKPERRTIPTLFILVLFFSAPQFLFGALSEHEDVLTLFLSARAVVWLAARPPAAKSLAIGLWYGILAVAVKYSTAVFLPFAVLVLAGYFYGKERVLQLLRPKTVLMAALFLPPLSLLAFLPDILVAASRNMTVFDHMHRMSQYHVESVTNCGLHHFLLRMAEFLLDGFRMLVGIVPMDFASGASQTDFMPKGCAHESTSLAAFLPSGTFMRENTGFGFVCLVAFMSLFLAKGKARTVALASLLCFTASVAVYSYSFVYWSGISRYFVVGMLILPPAFMIATERLQAITSPKHFRWGAEIFLLPVLLVMLKSNAGLNKTPAIIGRGDTYSYRAGGILPALKTVEGRANIYFNDVMSFYTLLRVIPSNQVSLKKEIIPGVTNIVALPKSYTNGTNWHDDYWLLPIPSAQGDFVFMGPVKKSFGNVVPTAFFMNRTPKTPAALQGHDIRRYEKKQSPAAWVRGLGKAYRLQTFTVSETAKHYFIYRQDDAAQNGLCMQWQEAGVVSWYIGTPAMCKEPGLKWDDEEFAQW